MMSRDILLFAGQGSSLSFNRSVLLSTSATAARCLDAFHAALISEIDSLSATEKLAAQDIISSFPRPTSLVDPEVQNNPVVQGVALYVHQILDFISHAASDTETSYGCLSKPLETAGFCSGVLPAVVIASCPFPDCTEFLHVALAGLRLAFWIGLRSLFFCQSVKGDGWDDQPWALTIRGLELSELQGLLSKYTQETQDETPLQVSAILSERLISVAGPGRGLNEFKTKYLPTSASARFANIHGYYHGGSLLQGTLREILEDVQRRNIPFPSWEGLRIPVRSTVDGTHLSSRRSRSSLLETMLENILLHQVDWRRASELLLTDTLDWLDRDSHLRCNILAIGPNSRSLMGAINSAPTHPRLRVANLVPDAPNGPSSNDIAIVGMSVNYPSGKGAEQLWETLEKGLNVVKEVPSSRFQVSDYYNTDDSTNNPRKMSAKHGNFLDDPFSFDNGFFQISPREAKSMDPQQRLLLHAALDAMEDAGYVPDATPSFSRKSTAVYVGCATLDYVDNTRNDIDVYYSPGTLRAFLSGRISYAFQLKGPSVVIDTACSSSAVALYQACRALQAGDCSSALAGGVNVISSPDMYLGLSRAHFLSPTGQCKPWDASADGYCRAEGCGLFVLKRLSDAVAEKDRIYGVIRGIEVNQCGTAKSITHPDSETQAGLFKRLLSKTRVDPNSIGVVEAHGTGTQAGDYAEVNSLQSAFGPRGPGNPLILSSIKGNIGHAEAASGAAGLAKLLMMMQKQRVPPQASHQTLNPRLSTIAEHNIVVPTRSIEWQTTLRAPRRALLNNFGAAGSNAALIVEEYARPLHSSKSPSRSHHILNLSAKTAEALGKLRNSYCAYLEANGSNSLLESLCYSTNARRQQFDSFRLSVTASSTEELLQNLKQATVPARAPPPKCTLTTFVFSGQGSIYPGMGAELLSTEPVFSDSVRLCNAMLADMGLPSTHALIGHDTDAFSTLGAKEQTIVSQCACFVLEYSLAQLWMAWGVVPDAVVGHSLGEFAALVVARVLTLRDALTVVARRASLMCDLCQGASTGMAACHLSPAKAEELLSRSGADADGLAVACENSPDDCVLAGPLSSLTRFVETCQAMGTKAKMLDVPYGFHSAAMDPILQPVAELGAAIRTNAPKIPIASSYLGRLLGEHDINPSYFSGHARQPVKFIGATEAIANVAGNRKMVFVEVGPAPITLPMLKATLRQTEAVYLPSLKAKETPWTSLCSALSFFYLQRSSIQWRGVYAGLDVQFLTNIPRYPLVPSTFVVPFRENAPSRLVVEDGPPQTLYRFLDGSSRDSANGTTFKSNMSKLADFIKAHNVGGVPLCPASVYIELAMEALALAQPRASESPRFQTLVDLTFDSPLIYSEARDSNVDMELSTDASSFRVLSEDGSLHCTGTTVTASDKTTAQAFARRTSYIKRQKSSVNFVDTFSTRILYDVVFPRVVAYSAPYITIKQLSIAASGLEGAGTFHVARPDSHFACNPAFTDTLLHAAGFVANSKISADEACICVKVERITVPTMTSSLYDRDLGVYCGLVESTDEGSIIADSYALDEAGSVVACVEGMHFRRLRLKSFQAHLARALNPTSTQKADTRVRNDSDVDVIPVAKPSIRPTVHASLSELCGIADADIEENSYLSDMGIDSLLLIELSNKLQQRFSHLSLGDSDFSSCDTVRDVEEVLQKVAATTESKPIHFKDDATDEARIHDFLHQVCGFSVNHVDKDATLESLGVDSLLSIELGTRLRQEFGIDIDQISELSIRGLEKAIPSGSSSKSAEKQQEPQLQLRSSKEQKDGYTTILSMDTFPMHLQKVDASLPKGAPLFLVHDGSGLCNVYSRLAKLGRDVHGIFSLDFSHIQRQITTMEDLASWYIDVAKLMDYDSIVLGGWSFGGVLAFEVSRQLRRRRRRNNKTPTVLGVVLIDSPHPVAHQPLPEAVISHVCGQMLPSHSPALRRVRAAVEAQFHRNAQLLANYDPGAASSDEQDAPCVMLKCRDSFDVQGLCGVAYPWLSDEGERANSVAVWETLVQAVVPTLEVCGNHFDLFSPENVEGVSTQLSRACKILERNG